MSHKVRVPGQVDSRKDFQPWKSELRPQIFLKLSIRELNYVVVLLGQKREKMRKVGCEFIRH